MRSVYLAVVLMTAGVIVVGLIFGMFLANVVWNAKPSIAQSTGPAPAPAAPSGSAKATFNPPDINSAPSDIREAVIYGATILTDTQKVLAGQVGNKLNCENCHFSAGATEGGKNGGISLVGVAATYPKYRDRQKYAVDLVARVND